jgi:hypothetical protein
VSCLWLVTLLLKHTFICFKSKIKILYFLPFIFRRMSYTAAAGITDTWDVNADSPAIFSDDILILYSIHQRRDHVAG